MDTDDSVVGLF